MGRNLFWRSALILLVFSVKLSAQEGLPTTGWPWGQTTIEESLNPRSSAPASSSIEIPYSNPPREEVYQELPVNEMQETEKVLLLSPGITRVCPQTSPSHPPWLGKRASIFQTTRESIITKNSIFRGVQDTFTSNVPFSGANLI
jgi:hypothetical protein